MKGLCVITDENNMVVSISLIPGLKNVPKGYHVYFPAKKHAVVGHKYTEEIKVTFKVEK